MPSMDVEFDLACAKCHKTLDGATFKKANGFNVVEVEPCDDCLQRERDEGYNEGYEQAESDHDI
jgi:hypothetical protein